MRFLKNGMGMWLVLLVQIGFVFVGATRANTDTANSDSQADASPLMDQLLRELDYSMANLEFQGGIRPYFLGYSVYDEESVILQATLGALKQDNQNRKRSLNIDMRVGDYELDNTHQLRGGGPAHDYGSGNIAFPMEDNGKAIGHILWYYTDREFKRAARRYSTIKTNLKVKVEEEDQSDDFSREEPHVFIEEPARLKLDAQAWREKLRRVSAIARDFPLIYSSTVTLGTYAGTRYIVNNEGTKLQTAQTRYRITLAAGTKADDGMDLGQTFSFNSAEPDDLPDETTIANQFRQVIDQVLALREAPLAEPYIGPAILLNRASAVFFHEIFGHRIEGHRAKDVTEGQTFTKKVDQVVLPSFISVFDDPTRDRFGGIDLRGFYRFDDEGVQATRVGLVQSGILKSFLMSRRPVDNFPRSNGHGRRSPGNAVVARQANLIVESTKQVSFPELKEALREECRRQDKPYGLLFDDISGGFTTTSRRGPQSFKVLPIVVYKVYADGRPDELLRGADIVGTPLTCFEKIVLTGDDPEVFNGSCGAESGWVPVSAVSPSILVSTIEIEKRQRDQSRPPILPPPL
ncbi:MAG: metallopeptidase TldD-related protein [Planctomycetota bacterium]